MHKKVVGPASSSLSKATLLLAALTFFLSGLVTVTVDQADAQDPTGCAEGTQSGGVCIIEGDLPVPGPGCPGGTVIEISGECFLAVRKRRQAPTCSGVYMPTINSRCVFAPPAPTAETVCPASSNGWPIRAELAEIDGVVVPNVCIEDELPPYLPCSAPTTADPESADHCLYPVDNAARRQVCAAGFTIRLGARCFRVEPTAGVTCAQGTLEYDGCRVDGGLSILGPRTCPEGGVVLYVDGVCFVHRDALAGGGCDVNQVPDPDDALLCRLPVDLRSGGQSCPTGFALASDRRGKCFRYDPPVGQPALNCSSEEAVSSACVHQIIHEQTPSQAELMADQETTLAYFSCEGSMFASYRVRSFDDDRVGEGDLVEGPAGIYTATYTAPAGHYEVLASVVCETGLFIRIAHVQFVDPAAPDGPTPPAGPSTPALRYEGPFTVAPADQSAAFGFDISPAPADSATAEPGTAESAATDPAPKVSFTG